MLEHRSTIPMLLIFLACMLGLLSHNTNSCCGMTFLIIKRIQFCIQVASVIMEWSMMMCNFVSTN